MSTQKAMKPMKPKVPKSWTSTGILKDNKQDKLAQGPMHGVKTHSQTNTFPYKGK